MFLYEGFEVFALSLPFLELLFAVRSLREDGLHLVFEDGLTVWFLEHGHRVILSGNPVGYLAFDEAENTHGEDIF